MEFEDALQELGFVRADERPVTRGSRIHAMRPNRFLTYFVHTYADGTALFTFEFAIGEYLSTVGLQVGSDEHLNQFLYPRMDVRGTQDAAWLADAIDHAEALLGAVDFVDSAPGDDGDPPETAFGRHGPGP